MPSGSREGGGGATGTDKNRCAQRERRLRKKMLCAYPEDDVRWPAGGLKETRRDDRIGEGQDDNLSHDAKGSGRSR